MTIVTPVASVGPASLVDLVRSKSEVRAIVVHHFSDYRETMSRVILNDLAQSSTEHAQVSAERTYVLDGLYASCGRPLFCHVAAKLRALT